MMVIKPGRFVNVVVMDGKYKPFSPFCLPGKGLSGIIKQMTILTRQSRRKGSISTPKTITGEELLAMGDIGRLELVKGEIIEHRPTGQLHGYIEALITALLFNFVRQNKLGRVISGETGIYTGRNPDTVRGMDVAFISNKNVSRLEGTGFLDVAPELVVEVMSPSDRWTEIQEKLAEYFNIGVQLVWLVDPQLEQIHVYRSLDDAARLTADNDLTAPEILPGFSVPVSEIFESAG
jgi:Uma2 family endonuclease